jgi:hypothetical protein
MLYAQFVRTRRAWHGGQLQMCIWERRERATP